MNDDDDDEPDIFDLNDWLMYHNRKLFDSIRYLSDTGAFRRLALIEWRKAGCPDIQE